ncbi:Fe-S oxidoreductase [Candidatus Scalindua japonica]|uniref:Fe-S oxidoreductase n=2 Tax=Candidatus Scalindua japonica TaxID=1284222 RepID=A0A286U3W2_9BACT|nr:Fe-S oxidoreductase [Candidatus Scalindua japonica]
MHCYSGGNTASVGELSTDEAKKMLDELADCGSPFMILSGGEPFLRADVFELGRYAREIGLMIIASSNGTVVTPQIASNAADAGIGYVGVSLDGLAETNNYFRGSRDAYNNALQGMRNLRDAGIKTGLRFTITRNNCHELPQIMELLVKEGFHRLCVYHLEYAGRGIELMNNDLSPDERRRAVDDLFRKTVEINSCNHDLEVLTVGNYADAAYIYMKVLKEDPQKAKSVYEHFLRNGGEGCGEKLAYIDELGNVYASQHLKAKLGNIRERSFKEIWNSDNEFLWKLRNRESLFRGKCAECRFLEICRGGSRARALAVYDDFCTPDPSCYLTEEEIHKPVHEELRHD